MPEDPPLPHPDDIIVKVQLSKADADVLMQAMQRTQEDNPASFIHESLKHYISFIDHAYSGIVIMLADPAKISSTPFHSGPLDNAATVGEIERREQAAGFKPTLVVNNQIT